MSLREVSEVAWSGLREASNVGPSKKESLSKSGSGFLCKHVDGEGTWEEWRRSGLAGMAVFRTGKLECLSEIQVVVVNSRQGSEADLEWGWGWGVGERGWKSEGRVKEFIHLSEPHFCHF